MNKKRPPPLLKKLDGQITLSFLGSHKNKGVSLVNGRIFCVPMCRIFHNFVFLSLPVHWYAFLLFVLVRIFTVVKYSYALLEFLSAIKMSLIW